MRRKWVEKVVCAVVLAALASCDSGGPATPEAGVLRGTVDVRDRLARTVAPGGVQVRITDAGGRAVEVPTDSDGSWAVAHRGEGPYRVTATKDGYGAPELSGISAGVSDLQVPVLERSSARVRTIETARFHLPETAEPSLELRFTVAAVGAFPAGAGRQVFRIFLGEPDRVSPTEHEATLALIVSEDDPGIEAEGDGFRIHLPTIRGVDVASLASRPTEVLVVGATENAVLGPGASTAFVDVAEAGATTRVTR